MEAQTIEWHENGYKNWKISLDRNEERLIEKLEEAKGDRIRLDFYKFQIDEAKKLSKLKFDREKFRIIKKGGVSIPPKPEGMGIQNAKLI